MGLMENIFCNESYIFNVLRQVPVAGSRNRMHPGVEGEGPLVSADCKSIEVDPGDCELLR